MNPFEPILKKLREEIPPYVKLIAVSKTKPVAMLQEAYDAGQRIFGENYVQEITEKNELLPGDIEWHFIGHLQTNKVKFIAPFVSWIHTIDSEKLLAEIDKQAKKNGRVINCLLQVHIAQEETKFGCKNDEIFDLAKKTRSSTYENVRICGLMGMASFSYDQHQVATEFRKLKMIFEELRSTIFAEKPEFTEISMGMSSDWKLAVNEGSTMVRIGSSIFGTR